MTSSTVNLRDHHTTSTNDLVEAADGTFLSIAGYGRRHLEIDQDTGNFTGTTGDIELQRVAHAPQLENHNLLSVMEMSKAPLHALPNVPCCQHHQITA